MVVLWKTDEIGDRLQRQLVGDVFDKVSVGLLRCGDDDPAGRRRQVLLKLGNTARREEPRDQLAQPRVYRRVGVVDQAPRGPPLLGGYVLWIPHKTTLEGGRPRVGGA